MIQSHLYNNIYYLRGTISIVKKEKDECHILFNNMVYRTIFYEINIYYA